MVGMFLRVSVVYNFSLFLVYEKSLYQSSLCTDTTFKEEKKCTLGNITHDDIYESDSVPQEENIPLASVTPVDIPETPPVKTTPLAPLKTTPPAKTPSPLRTTPTAQACTSINCIKMLDNRNRSNRRLRRRVNELKQTVKLLRKVL